MKPMLVFLLTLSLFLIAVFAQAQTGALQGTVTNEGDKAAPGCWVEVVGTTRGAVTKIDGTYFIARITAGTWTIKVTSLGADPVKRHVTIVADSTTTLDVDLTKSYDTGPEIRFRAEDSTPHVPGGPTIVTASDIQHSTYTVENVAVSLGANLGIRGGRTSEISIRRDGIEISDGLLLNGMIATGPTTLVDFKEDEEPVTYVPEARPSVSDNPFRSASGSPYSTFSIDVDNASYTNIRGMLARKSMPSPTHVRIEELINYFTYDYPEPIGEHPFRFDSEVTECPWNRDHLLVRLAIRGKDIHPQQAPPSNLVFLIDVSGSMSSPNKLGLLQQSFETLIDQLRPSDCISIVTYAGNSGLVLETTPGSQKQKIRDAIRSLRSGGSTAGAAGIQLAYNIAAKNFLAEGNNRVILATDGDFNVGVSSTEGLVKLIEQKRDEGIFLSVLGFGAGHYQDQKMEQLADNGNGNYYYIDRLQEGERVLSSEMSGTLYTVAKDVKLQIRFNPAKVAAYRLIGYENRILTAQQFDDDTKDAGELGAGHQVTALYQIVPVGTAVGFDVDTTSAADYAIDEKRPELLSSNDLLLARLRYKRPDENVSRLVEHLVDDRLVPIAGADDNTRFAAAVASWGMILRGSSYAGNATYESARKLAAGALGSDPDGYRKECVKLMKDSESLAASLTESTSP